MGFPYRKATHGKFMTTADDKWRPTDSHAKRGRQSAADLTDSSGSCSTFQSGSTCTTETSFDSMASPLRLLHAPGSPLRIPGAPYFASNHALVNTERKDASLPPLRRSVELDTIARWHAEAMAAANRPFHSDPKEMKELLNGSYNILGENVARGENERFCMNYIHGKMISKRANVNNMLDDRYTEMGMATARGSSGHIFVCQIYRG